jgi:Tol biopolymer transport system component
LIGRTLSHYRITGALGAGGMGEVYRATDTTLGREVAIKILPPEVAQDADRLARFKREAQLLASLNHPHVASIYGLEEVDGQRFLALELVEGEDLKARLARGPIPVDEVFEIARQIAEAVESAHNKGIVHRDLKPANVKVTPEGQVKVLDFGLAKAWTGEGSDGSSPPKDISQSPTLARNGTGAGMILGTAAYMAPEQARGKPVDKRADVWSFGVLLWEMLTGRTLFTGDTATDVIAAVVTKEPDLDALPKATPAAVRRLLSRCLRKDPRQRLPDLGAARVELQDVLAGSLAEMEAPRNDGNKGERTEPGRALRERAAWAALALVLTGLAAFLALRESAPPPEARPPAHFVLETPDDLGFWGWSPVSVSPDGLHVVVTAGRAGGERQLWIRSLDSPDLRELPGTVGALGAHFWSPDSAQLAFVANGELRKLTLAGGAVQRIGAAPSFGGGTWGTDGTIVFASAGADSSLFTIPQTGGEARPLTERDGTAHVWPQFLPDGRHLLMTVVGGKEAGLYVLSLDAPAQRRRIRPEVTRFQFVAPGALLFTQEGVLRALRFDGREFAAQGEAAPLASSVAMLNASAAFGWFSSSATGRAAWVSAQSRDLRLDWVDRSGRRIGGLGEIARYGQIVLSPDDKRVAAEISDGRQYDLWLIDVARGVSTRLTTDPTNERDPVFSPDSQEVVYSSDADGDQNLLRRRLQGGEPAAPFERGIGQTPKDRDVAKGWFRERSTLVFLTIGAERTLWEVPLEAGGAPQPLAQGFFIDQPRLSPDGRSLAFISAESGRFEVYVQPYRGKGEKLRVSVNGGGQPRWRGDGKELFFLAPEGALMAVPARSDADGLQLGLPTTLVPARILDAVVQGADYSDYAVTADGQRFLVKRPANEAERQRIHVLLDWPSLLK